MLVDVHISRVYIARRASFGTAPRGPNGAGSAPALPLPKYASESFLQLSPESPSIPAVAVGSKNSAILKISPECELKYGENLGTDSVMLLANL